ncbi:hypothetical protein N0V84_012257 [Fusarium piperis]|uniref:Uncharacterized protein n=1 Tax=Fusarium piperis TaxID=1435070 RepID=A0A9W8T9N4_9HYPO|nr:hypothetical protein N0V84_012257 [Fusarium piperis]
MQRLLALRRGETPSLAPVARPVEDDFDDDDGSDDGILSFDDDGSDDGILLMAKAKKKPAPSTSRPPAFNPRRRDTNISIASTETAKKVPTLGRDTNISIASTETVEVPTLGRDTNISIASTETAKKVPTLVSG